MAKTKPSLPAPESLDDLESLPLTVESSSLQRECDERLSPAVVQKLKIITFYISRVGFSLAEACKLSNVDFEEFSLLIETEPLIQKVIDIKELEYKKGLLHTVSARARDGDDKLAQWLLERRFPDEFSDNKKKTGGGMDGKDVLFEAIEFIQKSGDREPLIKQTSGRAIAVRVSSTESKKPSTFGEKVRAIKDILK